MRLAAGVALTAVLLAALLLALSSTRDDGQSPVGIAVEPTATADRTTPSAVASQPASPRVATESPARPDGYTLSLEASRAMRAAVAAARGKSGLNGHEAKDLVAMLDRFDRAIGDRDADAARSLASSMVEVVRELVERNEVSSEAGGRLQAAADDVLTSAEALD